MTFTYYSLILWTFVSLGDLPTQIDSSPSIQIQISILNDEIRPIQNLMMKSDSIEEQFRLNIIFKHFLIKIDWFWPILVWFWLILIKIWLSLIHFLFKCQLNDRKLQNLSTFSIDFIFLMDFVVFIGIWFIFDGFWSILD